MSSCSLRKTEVWDRLEELRYMHNGEEYERHKMPQKRRCKGSLKRFENYALGKIQVASAFS